MRIKHKHGAVIWTAVLGVIFVGLLVWYLVAAPSLRDSREPVATSTPVFVEPAPRVITRSGTYYEITAQVPTLTPLSPEHGPAAIGALERFVTERIDEFLANADVENITPQDAELFGLREGRRYVLGLEYELYTSSSTVSYFYTIYEDTLGAHPNAHFRTFTFARDTGALLSLSDLFLPESNYLYWLSERARRDIPLIIQERSGYLPDTDYLNSGTEPNPESFQNFYLDGSDLVFAFPPYQVGPYAQGSVLLPISLSQLLPLLAPEFLP